uniref:Uncharacterized protein n=1 Tax=Arion vulgaris TaxID=1028688 RepID=A0A0B7AJV2_9EUPU
MSNLPPSSRSVDDKQAGSLPVSKLPVMDQPIVSENDCDKRNKTDENVVRKIKVHVGNYTETKEDSDDVCEEQLNNSQEIISDVLISGDILEESTDSMRRPRLTTSNSGAEIMLGLETDDGKSAEVEIDSLESDELQPEEIPKGRVRKTSIVDKLSKSKESELIALSILESAGQRQREFEKLINEHQELVQEISRTPSAENIVQGETGRDP